jgi:hypothetical protein
LNDFFQHLLTTKNDAALTMIFPVAAGVALGEAAQSRSAMLCAA